MWNLESYAIYLAQGNYLSTDSNRIKHWHIFWPEILTTGREIGWLIHLNHRQNLKNSFSPLKIASNEIADHEARTAASNPNDYIKNHWKH